MSTVVKDLGAVSAYAYAVEKGYTGTEAEFAELMADYAEIGQRAKDAAESALNSKTAAQTAATTATTKASEAATSAQTATTKAGEATTAAGTATTAKNDAVAAKTAAETAQGKAEDAQAAAESVAESIPSDYSQLSEDVSDLKEDLGRWRYSVKQRNDWIKINTDTSFANGDVVYVKPLSTLNVTGNVIVYGFVGTTRTNLGDVTQGSSKFFTLASDYDYLQVVYHLTAVDPGTNYYESIIAKVGENGTISGTLLSVLSRVISIEANEQMYNSAFAVPIPESIKGIVNVNIYNPQYSVYEEYRITSVRRNSTWYMYMVIQGYDGSSWVLVDSVEVKAENATNPQPLVEVIDSKYHRYTVTVVWSNIGSPNFSGKDYTLKNNVVNNTQIGIAQNVKKNTANIPIPSYELADNVNRLTNVVTVKKDGTGDYTTIKDAYDSIKDSAFDNQYEIVVYPGTYNENNLIPPRYTHTHGIFPMQTIVDSTGTGDAEINNSVFDQQYGPSKLSNLYIKSKTKYCVHQDVELVKTTLVNENLFCEKLSGGSQVSSAVIGIGADFGGAKFVWRNCTFVNGEVGAHTNPNNDPNANQHLIFEDCTFINAYVWLGVAGNTYGNYVCELRGCKTNKGNSGLKLKFGSVINGVPVNFPWQIIGSNNNLAPLFDNTSDTSVSDYWDAISTTDKTYAIASETIAKGSFVTLSGAKATNTTDISFIVGLAVSDGVQNGRTQVWKAPFIYTGNNGEYGLDANGNLDSGASNKIGRVYNNIFYPFYS